MHRFFLTNCFGLFYMVIEDKCAIGLRAVNLMQLSWMSYQSPSMEAAITGSWTKQKDCE